MRSSPSELAVDSVRLLPPTDDELRRWAHGQRFFVSSVMSMTDERASAIAAISRAGAAPVAWELLTPSPTPPEDAWLSGVESSDYLFLLLGSRYGVRRPDGYSATHREFLRAEELGLVRWVLADRRVSGGERDGYLRDWLAELSAKYSYDSFASADDVGRAVQRTIADMAAYRMYTWYKFGPLVLRADRYRLTPPPATPWSGGATGRLEVEGRVSDPTIRSALASQFGGHRSQQLVIEGQLFEAVLDQFSEKAERGGSAYDAHFRLSIPRLNGSLTFGMTFHEGNQTWSSGDLAELAIREIIGLPVGPRPSYSRGAEGIDWGALIGNAHGNPHLLRILGELVAGEALLTSGALARVDQLEVRLVGPPAGLIVRVVGTHAPGQGAPTQTLAIEDRLRLEAL